MKSSSHEVHKQYAFESYCKSVLRHEACSLQQKQERRGQQEMSLHALPEEVRTVCKAVPKSDRLLPFPVIRAAVGGDPDAVAVVFRHFSGYIAALSKRHFYDRNGNYVTYIDNDIRSRLEAKLIFAILRFNLN